jgi:hypothetical protein
VSEQGERRSFQCLLIAQVRRNRVALAPEIPTSSPSTSLFLTASHHPPTRTVKTTTIVTAISPCFPTLECACFRVIRRPIWINIGSKHLPPDLSFVLSFNYRLDLTICRPHSRIPPISVALHQQVSHPNRRWTYLHVGFRISASAFLSIMPLTSLRFLDTGTTVVTYRPLISSYIGGRNFLACCPNPSAQKFEPIGPGSYPFRHALPAPLPGSSTARNRA